MRITLLLAASFILLASCKKDKFNTVPTISYKEIKPNTLVRGGVSSPEDGPMVTFHLTDAEGDFGRLNDTTISYIYIKNISTPPFKLDSFLFPELPGLDRKNIDVDVTVELFSVLAAPIPPVRPHVDSMFFEIYVKDLAKNKSNTIITADPVLYIWP